MSKIKKSVAYIFRHAPLPAVMSVISFLLFIGVYLFVTITPVVPFYWKGLRFMIPCLCFVILTMISLSGKVHVILSNFVTAILIIVLGVGSAVYLFQLSIEAATTDTTDIALYERVLDRIGYPQDPYTQHFPAHIPEEAEQVQFHYNPAFAQGGELCALKFQIGDDYIEEMIEDISRRAKWIGAPDDEGASQVGVLSSGLMMFDYRKALPSDLEVYLLMSRPYKQAGPENRSEWAHWNHGEASLIAISRERNEVFFKFDNW